MKIYILQYCCGDSAGDDEVRGVFDDFNKLKKIIYENTKGTLKFYQDWLNHPHPAWLNDKTFKEEQNIINHILNCKDCYEINALCLDESNLGFYCYEAELNKEIE